jgi:hypothetical protein
MQGLERGIRENVLKNQKRIWFVEEAEGRRLGPA